MKICVYQQRMLIEDRLPKLVLPQWQQLQERKVLSQECAKTQRLRTAAAAVSQAAAEKAAAVAHSASLQRELTIAGGSRNMVASTQRTAASLRSARSCTGFGGREHVLLRKSRRSAAAAVKGEGRVRYGQLGSSRVVFEAASRDARRVAEAAEQKTAERALTKADEEIVVLRLRKIGCTAMLRRLDKGKRALVVKSREHNQR